MLSKKNRLDKHQYNLVFKRGKIIYSPLFTMKYIKNLDNKRFSVVVPRKVLKKAFQRNNLRRFVYNILRENINTFNTGDYIFIIKKAFNSSSKEELKKEILETVSKI